MAQKKKTEITTAQKVGVAVGLTTAVVAAAGTYFLYGSKSAAKNRKAVKSWMLKAKAEILEKLEEAKEMTQEDYEHLVNTVATVYSELKTASRADIKAFKDEMKDQWRSIERVAKPKKKPATKKATPAKKAVKKVAKKATD